ncbi:hypothetical protein Ciccas_007198 [Cichlidogyrus casuarinus]|uniref:Uncharacterized protein n=1 Tax=Cichlidogyrus casuarinus TaxID=1844966 RepID=A0ABD2Q3J4_9PLAT
MLNKTMHKYKKGIESWLGSGLAFEGRLALCSVRQLNELLTNCADITQLQYTLAQVLPQASRIIHASHSQVGLQLQELDLPTQDLFTDPAGWICATKSVAVGILCKSGELLPLQEAVRLHNVSIRQAAFELSSAIRDSLKTQLLQAVNYLKSILWFSEGLFVDHVTQSSLYAKQLYSTKMKILNIAGALNDPLCNCLFAFHPQVLIMAQSIQFSHFLKQHHFPKNKQNEDNSVVSDINDIITRLQNFCELVRDLRQRLLSSVKPEFVSGLIVEDHEKGNLVNDSLADVPELPASTPNLDQTTEVDANETMLDKASNKTPEINFELDNVSSVHQVSKSLKAKSVKGTGSTMTSHINKRIMEDLDREKVREVEIQKLGLFLQLLELQMAKLATLGACEQLSVRTVNLVEYESEEALTCSLPDLKIKVKVPITSLQETETLYDWSLAPLHKQTLTIPPSLGNVSDQLYCLELLDQMASSVVAISMNRVDCVKRVIENLAFLVGKSVECVTLSDKNWTCELATNLALQDHWFILTGVENVAVDRIVKFVSKLVSSKGKFIILGKHLDELCLEANLPLFRYKPLSVDGRSVDSTLVGFMQLGTIHAPNDRVRNVCKSLRNFQRAYNEIIVPGFTENCAAVRQLDLHKLTYNVEKFACVLEDKCESQLRFRSIPSKFDSKNFRSEL